MDGVKEARAPAVYEVKVHPTVIVVVKEGAAGAAALRQIPLRGSPGIVDPRNAALRGRDRFKRKDRRHCGGPGQLRLPERKGSAEAAKSAQQSAAGEDGLRASGY